jgi:tetratricopeptide (TPR) repeat protein
MMRVSRSGITGLIIILISTFFLANCGVYNRIKSRQNLVDGAEAYKARKFDVAEALFRDAISRDPEGETAEGKTAQVFLARTLHSKYISKRELTPVAEEAIEEYKKVLAQNPNDQSSFKAVANLYENLGKQNEWQAWVTERANNEQISGENRAEALVSLAAKQYSCANDISDNEPVKKTVEKDGKPVFEFTKPENEADFNRLKECAQKGLELANKAVELNPNSDSAWSYKANLLVQKMRIAEMEGNTQEKDSIKTEADTAKAKFTALAEEKRKREAEEEARKQAEAEAANKKK